MKTPASRKASWRCVVFTAGLVGVLTMLFSSGCATAVKVESTPAGATVVAGGKALGSTPTEYQVENAAKPVVFEFSLTGYFPKSITYTAGSAPQPVSVVLAPTTLAKSFEVNSEPAGASVTLDGRPVGTTPVTVPVVFTRRSENAPWTPQTIALTKTNYQTESFQLTSDTGAIPVVPMALLKDDRVYSITATTAEGAPLTADISVDGVPINHTTPYELPITFQRRNKTQPWPKFNLSVEIPTEYRAATVELNYLRDRTVALKLAAITEIPVATNSPSVVVTDRGAAYQMVERTSVATLRTSDDSTAITDLKQVTNYIRQDKRPAGRAESVSAYAVTPDGSNVVFAVTETDTEDAGHSLYSNLYIKKAADASGGVSRLTSGSRYIDGQPYIANDSSNILVFTSNRGDRSKADIFRVTLAEGRLSGGISRLTNDNRFNYQPTYAESNQRICYLSVEPGYPKAEVQLSTIKNDGFLPTQLPNVAEYINHSNADKIFFVKKDPDTNTRQIYSITADGKLETALLNQEDFRKSNCIQPFVSVDGQRVLFVSDHSSSDKSRVNYDVFMVNADGSNLQRLTYNESDDFLPMFSPTEEGVIFFLSTRGGATNVWRCKLVR